MSKEHAPSDAIRLTPENHQVHPPEIMIRRSRTGIECVDSDGLDTTRQSDGCLSMHNDDVGSFPIILKIVMTSEYQCLV